MESKRSVSETWVWIIQSTKLELLRPYNLKLIVKLLKITSQTKIYTVVRASFSLIKSDVLNEICFSDLSCVPQTRGLGLARAALRLGVYVQQEQAADAQRWVTLLANHRTVSHCVTLCPTVSRCVPLCRSLGENVAGIAHAHARVRYTHLHRFAVQTIQSRYNLALVNHSYKTVTKYELNKINYLIKTYIVSFCLKISEL